MAQLPKSIIKKYGISKKAWTVFRQGKKKAVKKRQSKTRPVKRRSSLRRKPTMARKKRVRGRTKSKGKFDMDLVWLSVGSGASGMIGGLVNQVAPTVAGNLASLLGGGALMYFMGGIPSKIGKGAVIKSAGDFIEENLAPRLFGQPAAVSSNNVRVI